MSIDEPQFVRNHVMEKLARDEVVASMLVKLVSNVQIAGLVKACGFDTFFVDLDHSTFSLETVSQICTHALAIGLTPFVRVPVIEHQYVCNVLDGGALGVIGPHIETVAEAEKLVRLAKFPPVGKRGLGGGLPHYGYQRINAATSIPIMNRITTVATMIETAAALDNAEAIADVEGVDILLVGCNDLAAEMGMPGDLENPRMEEAVKHLITVARSRGKHLWIGGLQGRFEMIERLVLFGARVVSAGGDGEYMLRMGTERAKTVHDLQPKLNSAKR